MSITVLCISFEVGKLNNGHKATQFAGGIISYIFLDGGVGGARGLKK